MLGLRTLTAVVLGIAVLLGIFFLPLLVFNVFAALFMLMAAWEVAKMFWPSVLWQRLIFLTVVLLVAVITGYYFAVLGIVIGGIWWLFVPMLLVRFAKTDGLPKYGVLTKYIVGLLVFVPFYLALLLSRIQFGPFYLLYILLLVWVNDIGAYFAGTFYGKTLLAPHISPKKTWEGLFGGLVLSMVVVICGGFLLNIHGIKWVSWVVLSIVVSLWSVIGDLFESMLKRIAQVKDSGNLLPGHGGVYDRIDSLTAALPLFVVAIIICGI